jgi:D-alanyl-D-alanine carboxypeptidase (penicillin-binding protein 5/6)
MIFKKNKFLCTILAFILIYAWLVPALASDVLNESDAVPAPPDLTIDAEAALLLDAETGEVLYSQNADSRCYPASTTKIMTAYLTLKYGDLSASYTLPEGIYAGLDQYSSSAKLQVGEEVTVYQLLQCLLIASANEAANSLAYYISGSIADFVTLMNEEAQALGCTDTHFANPNGLHDEDHYTTARDLSLMALAALKYDTFLEICGTTEATIPATNLSEERTLTTTNYLLPGSTHPEYAYEGTLGVKTGFTTPAGYCLVSEASRDGRTLLAVVLGAKATKSGTTETIGSFTESAGLLSWGFANYDTALQYQAYLAALPQETPEPSQEPTPEPTPEETPEPSEAPTPSPEPTSSPSPSPTVTPEPTAEISPEPTQAAATLLSGVAETFGVSPQFLLLGAAGLSALGLLLFLLLLVHMLRTRKE